MAKEAHPSQGRRVGRRRRRLVPVRWHRLSEGEYRERGAASSDAAPTFPKAVRAAPKAGKVSQGRAFCFKALQRVVFETDASKMSLLFRFNFHSQRPSVTMNPSHVPVFSCAKGHDVRSVQRTTCRQVQRRAHKNA